MPVYLPESLQESLLWKNIEDGGTKRLKFERMEMFLMPNKRQKWLTSHGMFCLPYN